jgi:hypothetical protein
MNSENYDPPTFEEVMREKEDTITALRAEVADLHLQLDAAGIEDMRREIAFLRDGRDVAVSLCESLGNELAARNAEVRALREKADELLQACDDSDGAQYGTLATKFVRAVLLTGELGPGGEG